MRPPTVCLNRAQWFASSGSGRMTGNSIAGKVTWSAPIPSPAPDARPRPTWPWAMIRFGVSAVAEEGKQRQAGRSGGAGRLGMEYFGRKGQSPEEHGRELETHPILAVSDAHAFAPDRAPDFAMPFTAQHWNVLEAHVRDPDGRIVSLQAPLPEGVIAPDADAHHEEKYGHA